MSGNGDTAGLRVLAIVPAYNEAESIESVIAALREHAPTCDVLVVDDGSHDATAARVPEGIDGISVIRLPFNLGIGGAMQTGYRYAEENGYDVAVQVDGDGQHPPDQLPKILAPLLNGGPDLVIGSRFLDEGKYRQGPARLIGSTLLGFVLRILTGRRITDCTSGFRAANRRVICAYAQWYPDDYPEPEVVLLLHRAGFRVEEAAVEMNPRSTGRTSISLHQGLFYVIKVTAALLLDTTRDPWPRGKESET